MLGHPSPMPALGESVTEGTVTRWLKHVGDTVEVDEPLLEVSTDKVDTEIPSPAAGVFSRSASREDETVAVGRRTRRDRRGRRRRAAPRTGSAAAPAAAPSCRPSSPSRSRAAPIAEAPATARPLAAAAPAAASTDVVLPALGESVTEGTVTRWLKAVGDTVAVDEPLRRGLDRQGRHRDSPRRSPACCWRSTFRRTRRSRSAPSSASIGAGPLARPRRPQRPAPAPARRADARPHLHPLPRLLPLPLRPLPPAAGARVAGDGRTCRQRGCVRHPARAQARRAQRRRPVRRVQGTGVGGRIRKSDVEAAVCRQVSRQRRRLRHRMPHPPQHRRRVASSGVDRGCAGSHREDESAAQGDRRAHGRVAAGLGAADHRRRGRRHPDRAAARPREARLRGARGRQALVPAVLLQGSRRGAQGVPAGQRHRSMSTPARSPTTTARTSVSRSTPSADCWFR